MHRFSLFSIIFYCFLMPVQAQDLNNLKFTTYDTKDGLPSNHIIQMETDRHGFLWTATLVGLSRFDGVSFKNYYGKHGDTSGLPDEGSVGLARDKAGLLWVGGAWGLSRYDEVKDHFEYPFGYENPEMAEVQFMRHDGQRTLWVCCSKGLKKVDTEKMEVSEVVYSNPNLICMTADGAGGLWFAAIPNILGHIEGSSGQVKTWTTPGGISDILLGTEPNIWLASYSKGLIHFDRNMETFSEYRPSEIIGDNKLLFISQDISFCDKLTGDSIIWVSSNRNGLWLFNVQNRQFIRNILPQNGNSGALPSLRLCRLKWDQAGLLWLGTPSNGLCKMDMHDQEFKQAFTGIEGLSVRAVAADSRKANHLWIGTTGKGLLHYDQVQNKVVGQWQPPAKHRLVNSHVLSVYDDGGGKVWLGTPFDFYCLHNNRLERVPIMPGDSSSWVNDIFPNPEKGYLWLLTWKGPCKVDLKTRHASLIPMNLTSRSRNAYMYRKIWEDDRGMLWVATLRGLYRVNPVTQEQKHFPNPSSDFSANFFNDMLPGTQGQLWLGSQNGVYVFDLQSETFRTVKTTENIRQGVIYQLLRDQSDHLWAFSDIGIFRLSPGGRHFEKMTLPFNYVVIDANGGANSVFDLKGRFTSFDGGAVTTFDPLLIDQNPNPTQPVIDQFRIRNQAFPFSKESVAVQPLQLTYDQNFLSFDFTAINYTQSERMHFKYMLEDVDENWNEAQLNRTANYPQLRPGNYTFKVLVANSAGIWNEQPAIFKFTIRPPWWATWWFRLVALAALAYGAYTIVKNRIKKIRRQAEIREREAGYKQREAELQREVAEFSKQVAEVELAALRAQMNPHFVFNCLNSINTFILLNDPKNASSYLNKFSKLIRRVLDASRSEYISLQDELDTLRYYIELEQMRYGGRFQYQINAPENLQLDTLDLPPMLIQPYVENAIWHGLMNRDGNDGLLKIDLAQQDNVLKVTIEDNGVGRKKAAELKSRSAVSHKSHGMAVTDERIKIINELYGTEATVAIEDLFDTQGNGCGTRVVLQLPIKE